MKRLAFFYVILKLTLFLVMFVAASLLPYSKEMYERNFIYPSGEKHSIFSAFKAWDSQHYSYLIDKGYHQGDLSSAFFPLFPSASSLVNIVVQNSMAAGLITANIASFLMLYYFYRFVRKLLSEEIALIAAILLLVFPTAFQFSLMYSESIFLALVFAFFTYLYEKKYLVAGIISLFIPWARPIGILIVLPFLTYFLFDKDKKKSEIILPSFSEKVSFTFYPQLFSLFFPLLGFVLVLLFYKITTGDYLSSFTIQRSFISHYAVENLLAPQIFIDSVFHTKLVLHSFTDSMIDRVVFAFYLISLIFIYKKLDKTMFVYALAFGMLPLLGSFMSYSRYILAVFPIFILLATFVHSRHRQILFLSLFLFFFAFQVLASVLYALNYWVS